MFRGKSPQSVAGFGNGGSLARAAMINGGLIDGLSDLSQAFIRAPIARRKNELAAKKLEADATYRTALLNKGTAIRPEQVGRIAVDLHETARKAATDQYGKVDPKAWRDNYRRLRMLQPAQIRDMLPEDNADAVGADVGSGSSKELGDIQPKSQPPEDMSQGFFTMRRSGAPGGAQTLGDVLGGRWYGNGDSEPDTHDAGEPAEGESNLAQNFYPQAQDDDLANQFEGGAPAADLASHFQAAPVQAAAPTHQPSVFDNMDPAYAKELTSEDPARVSKALAGIPAGERLGVIQALRQMRANAQPNR